MANDREAETRAAPGDIPRLGQLLTSLQKLMLQLRTRIWQQRLQNIGQYHDGNHVRHAAELRAAIDRYIELCANSREPCDHTVGAGHTSPPAPPSTNGGPLTPAERPRETPLSNHLHQHTQAPTLPSPLIEHLHNSTWEHIHAAIRFTRQGDATKGRLHAQLANNAIDEAAHYMEEGDFARFMEELQHSLERLAAHHQAGD